MAVNAMQRYAELRQKSAKPEPGSPGISVRMAINAMKPILNQLKKAPLVIRYGLFQ